MQAVGSCFVTHVKQGGWSHPSRGLQAASVSGPGLGLVLENSEQGGCSKGHQGHRECGQLLNVGLLKPSLGSLQRQWVRTIRDRTPESAFLTSCLGDSYRKV